VKEQPDRVAYRVARGNAFLKRRENAQAIADFDRAIELDGTEAEAIYGRAIGYLRTGRRALAMRERARAISLDPRSDERFAEFGLGDFTAAD
jgi:Flp pilus assembly protein TadD